MAGATIVFCDIVGFSTNNIDRLRALISSLNADVTHELYVPFREAHSSRSVIILPTGDGMAITFVDPDDSRSWGSTIFSLVDRLMQWAKDHEALRIGVHTGRVASMLDINGRMNICGTAINEAQRIMDAAHPNQVLLSEAAYHEYVGTQSRTYTAAPFSKESPAKFKGPHS